MFNYLLLFGATFLTVIIGFAISKIEKEGFNWITVFVGLAIFSPLMFGGFSWYEEAFFLGVVLGARKYFLSGQRSREHSLSKVQLLFILYFLFAIINGFAYFYQQNGEIPFRKIRWVLFLILIFLIAKLSSKETFAFYRIRTNHLVSISAFLVFYISWQLIVQFQSGMTANSQYAQNPTKGYTSAIWVNTAYFTLESFVFFLLALFVLCRVNSKKEKSLAMLVLFLSAFSQSLTLSRGGVLLICLSSTLIVFWLTRSRKYSTAISILTILLFALLLGLRISSPTGVQDFVQDIEATVKIPMDLSVTSRENDRLQQFREVISVHQSNNAENKLRIFIGYGVRTSGDVLATRSGSGSSNDFSMSLLPSAFLEFGLIGLFLFLLLIMDRVRIRRKDFGFEQIIRLSCLFGTLATTLIVNNFDDLLLYAIILQGHVYKNVIRVA